MTTSTSSTSPQPTRLRSVLHDLQFALRFLRPRVADVEEAVGLLREMGQDATASRLKNALRPVFQGRKPTAEVVELVESLYAAHSGDGRDSSGSQAHGSMGNGVKKRWKLTEVIPEVRRLRDGNPKLSERQLQKLIGCGKGSVSNAVKALQARTVERSRGKDVNDPVDSRNEAAKRELARLDLMYERAKILNATEALKAMTALIPQYERLVASNRGFGEAAVRLDEVQQVIRLMKKQRSDVIEERQRHKAKARGVPMGAHGKSS